ncbi:MAG: Holliday junction branch migration protein RuvA [Anaerovoracaceae bacterium]
MIHFIKGTLELKAENFVVVETGGVGYKIFTPGNGQIYLREIGDNVKMYTLMIVREDDMSLYGFVDEKSLDLFQKLITVNGVGPKAGLAVLSAMPIESLRKAIAYEDAEMLTRANGIGKKTAQRIVLDLKDKVGEIQAGSNDGMEEFINGNAAGGSDLGDAKQEALSALIALGYSRGEAAAVLSKIKEADLSTEEYIKLALTSI